MGAAVSDHCSCGRVSCARRAAAVTARGVCGVHWPRHVTGPPPATLIPPLAPACEATRGRGGCVTLYQRVSVWAWRWQLAV